MTEATNRGVDAGRDGRPRANIVISASEGTLVGTVTSVTDRESAERAIARLLTFTEPQHRA